LNRFLDRFLELISKEWIGSSLAEKAGRDIGRLNPDGLEIYVTNAARQMWPSSSSNGEAGRQGQEEDYWMARRGISFR
jgi:hypothetical protein